MSAANKLNIVVVAQAGRIGYQALLCAASIRAIHSADEFPVYIAVPLNSKRWRENPELTDLELIDAFKRLDCEIVSFENADFGTRYPHSNKFYAILALPAEEPFLFLDSDTILTAPIRLENLNLDRPALKPGGDSWPMRNADARSIGEIWRSVYDFFGVDAEPFRDRNLPDSEYQCYPYYNAGLIYYKNAGEFGRLLLDMSLHLLKEKKVLGPQPINPWLDQIVLPIVLARLGVPRSDHVDNIQNAFVHYHFPFYLLVRHPRAAEAFANLILDPSLAANLRKDEAFRYYMSEEGMRIVHEVYKNVWAENGPRQYKAFEKELQKCVPLLR